MAIHFQKPGQQVGGFCLQGLGKPQQRLDSDFASVLLDQIDLSPM